jgi:putative spermidine/putrescine transport system substrate-binding protein
MAQAISRRIALRKLSVAAIAALSSTSIPFFRQAAAQSTAVRVTHFGGPYQALQKIVADPFKRAGLGDVQYEVETTASALAKIQAQKDNPPFDVVMMSRATTYRAGRAGLVMALTEADIPVTKETMAGTLGPGGFGAGFVLDTLGIMFDTRQVSTPLTSWMDFWRPEFKGKIVLPASSVSLSVYFLTCIAHALGNGKIDDISIEAAFKKIGDLKSSVRTFYSDPIQASQLIERGDVAIAPQLSIRIANTMKNAPTVGRSTPSEGGPSLPFDLSIPVNAGNAKGAKTYINFILGKEVQTGLAEQLLATPMYKNVSIPDNLKPYMLLETNKIWPTDEDYIASKTRDWLNRWSREIQA